MFLVSQSALKLCAGGVREVREGESATAWFYHPPTAHGKGYPRREELHERQRCNSITLHKQGDFKPRLPSTAAPPSSDAKLRHVWVGPCCRLQAFTGGWPAT
jgi:hypothetical protein